MRQFMTVVRTLRSQPRTVTDTFVPRAAIEFERRIDCAHRGEAVGAYANGRLANMVVDDCPRWAVNWLDRHEMAHLVTDPDKSRSGKAWMAPEVKETGTGISRGAIR